MTLLTVQHWAQHPPVANWTLEDWQHVVLFLVLNVWADGGVCVWCRPHEAMDPQLSANHRAGWWWFHTGAEFVLTIWVLSTGSPEHVIDHFTVWCLFAAPHGPPTVMVYSIRIMPHAIGPKLSRNSLRSILESSDE